MANRFLDSAYGATLALAVPRGRRKTGVQWRRVEARRSAVMRIIMIVLVGCFAVVTLIAEAAGPADEHDKARYSFSQVPDGMLRLNTATGQVSLCSKESAGW